MAKAEKLPSGNYRVRVQYYDEAGNRKHKSVTGRTEAEALYLAELERGKVREDKPEVGDMTLLTVCEKYIEDNKRFLSPTTITGYRQICRNYFPRLFAMRFQYVTNKAIQREIDADFTHSPKSLYNAVGFLSAVLKANDPDFVMSVKLPKRRRDVRPIPSMDEVGTILNAVNGTDMDIPVSLAIYLGMRLSEIRGLRFKDVNNGKAFIHTVIVQTDEGSVEKNSTKNVTSTRVVNLPSELYEKIRALNGDLDEFIVPLTHSMIEKRFTKLLQGLNIQHYKFHDLRHCNASIMLRLNVPTKYQMTRGGWATDSTLKTVYQHTMADYESIIDNQIYSFIDSLKG